MANYLKYQLVRVPQAVLAQYGRSTWTELVAAAESAADGVELKHESEFPNNYFNKRTSDGYAYFREGDKGGLLAGRATLFCQAF